MRTAMAFVLSLLLVDIADAGQTQPSVQCDAPKPHSARYIDDSDLIQVRLVVRANGSVLWNGAPVSKKKFDTYIAEAGRSDPRPLIVISAEPETKYSTAVSILRQVRSAGVLRTALDDIPATVPESTKR